MYNLSDSEPAGKSTFSEAIGRQNLVDDFSTRFSSITRERNQLQTCKLSQKNSFVILHRLMYTLSPKTAYLKSEIVEIGRFRTISALFLDFPRFCRYEREAGFYNCARGNGRGLTNSPRRWAGFNICPRSGWGLINSPRQWAGFNKCPRGGAGLNIYA